MTHALDQTTGDSAKAQRRSRRWLLVLGVWTVLAAAGWWWLVGGGGQGVSEWTMQGGEQSRLTLWERTRDWVRLMHLNFHRTYPWILLGPYVVWLASHFQLERGRLVRNTAVQLTACALFVIACYAINSHSPWMVSRVVIVSNHVETRSMPGPEQQTEMLRVEVSDNDPGAGLPGKEFMTRYHAGAGTSLVSHSRSDALKLMPTNLISQLEDAMKPALPRAGGLALSPLGTLLDLLAYGALAGVAHAVHFYGRYRERERRALFLESTLTRARLRSLQAQLQPHFLFNTLNAIATLLRRDPRAAETTLMNLSELLRLALSRSDEQEIPLREEMCFLERYMEIQQTRFGERLRFKQVLEDGTLDCLVPPLLLQPLVENAIHHGIEPTGNPGQVQVTAQRADTRLVLCVEDDGAGLNSVPFGKKAGGIGLANLRERLTALYGADHKMEVLPRAEGGVTVRIEIPWRSGDDARAEVKEER